MAGTSTVLTILVDILDVVGLPKLVGHGKKKTINKASSFGIGASVPYRVGYTIKASIQEHSEVQVRMQTMVHSNLRYPAPAPIIVSSSCTGLLLFRNYRRKNLYVCNPILGEYTIIPRVIENTFFPCVFLGFSSKTKEFKLLRFFKQQGHSHNIYMAEVHTLGTDSWRSIGEAPNIIHYSALHGTFFNGALHWFVVNDDETSLCCFNLGNEQFQPFPRPSQFAKCWKISHKMRNMMSMGAVKDQLFLCHPFNNSVLELWVMGDCGVSESWTRMHVITTSVTPKAIAFLDNGEILMLKYIYCQEFLTLHHHFDLVSYNPKEGSFRKITTNMKEEYQIVAYTPSFLSLKDAAVIVKRF
ncbi:F-box/kelch-repeat protein At3g06240-like [Castanea sativa]|uniref:F-box/kelch-repeat protein At3g06240-like n=1 Tax=Castanea sativa TaxID=21020 RepID=UPI003F649E0B